MRRTDSRMRLADRRVERAGIGGGVRRFGRVLAACAALAMAACTGPRTIETNVDPDTLDDPQFQAYLADAPLITVAEAYRAILILADGEDSAKSFEERKAALESRGIARAAWGLQSQNVIDKGSLAYMVAKVCRIRGGLNMTVGDAIGIGERRYAMRELIFRDMLADAVDYQYVTGGELIALIGKADAYMEKTGVYAGKQMDIGPEPAPGQLPDWAQPAATTQPSDSGR